jgi:SanA protein
MVAKKKYKGVVLKVMLLLIVAILVALVFYCNHTIIEKTEGSVYYDVSKIPATKVGLVLGTSKYLSKGKINPYFQYRIDATYKLYNTGKIKYIIVSGDNRKMNYNEPIAMKKSLIELGVADSIIYLDYAGFRTFDSVIRCREVFGQDTFTIVSQRFHLERAIYIAKRNRLKVYGFAANDVSVSMGIRTQVREYFARVKVFIDIIVDKQPKFLGEKVIIPN